MSKPEFAKLALDKSMIGFISVTKQRDSGFLQPRDLIKAIVIFKKADGFDTTKAKPFVSVSGVSLYNVEDAVKMKATETKIAQDVKIEVDKPEPKDPKPEEKKSANPEYDLVKDLVADKDVLEFLKSKLLASDKPKFSKSGNKVAEIKALQTLLAKFTLADKKTPSTAAAKIKKSGIDGIYGDGTADAIAWTTPDSTKPVTSIGADNVEHFAKWCKFMGITKAELEKIFAIKIEGGGKKDDDKKEEEPTGPKYYFVNKGWAYSPETDPYKTNKK
jgi:hypothetical protein